MSKSIVIASAVRTAIGSFNGALAIQPAYALAATCIKEALLRAKTEGAEVDELVLGHVLAAAQGQGPARQAAMAAGIPAERTAYAVNQICGSGLAPSPMPMFRFWRAMPRWSSRAAWRV